MKSNQLKREQITPRDNQSNHIANFARACWVGLLGSVNAAEYRRVQIVPARSLVQSNCNSRELRHKTCWMELGFDA